MENTFPVQGDVQKHSFKSNHLHVFSIYELVTFYFTYMMYFESLYILIWYVTLPLTKNTFVNNHFCKQILNLSSFLSTLSSSLNWKQLKKEKRFPKKFILNFRHKNGLHGSFCVYHHVLYTVATSSWIHFVNYLLVYRHYVAPKFDIFMKNVCR